MLKTTKIKMGKDKELIEEEIIESEIGQSSVTISRGQAGKWGFEVKAYGTNVADIDAASKAMIANARAEIQANISDIMRKQEPMFDKAGGGKE